MAERPLRLGTRGSPLALAQAEQVAKAMGGAEIVPIKTQGDLGTLRHETARASPSAAARPRIDGDKARFVREIERALLDGEVDLGVHSAKDLPSELPEGLELAGVPPREDPRDAYIGPVSSLGEVPEGSRIGTSSLRRRAQILALRPDLEIAELRGNVDTRLRRLEEGAFDGLVLAAAGLHRLGRAAEISFPIEFDELTPAPGQGALALEVDHRNYRAAALAESITDREALAALLAERTLVAELDASCNTPLGAVATMEHGGRMRLRAFCGLPDGSEWLRDEIEMDDADPHAVGRALAERMMSAGADDILARAEATMTGDSSSTSRVAPGAARSHDPGPPDLAG